MKEGKIMTESFGDKFRNKQQLSSENIDKEKLDEISTLRYTTTR